jgi:hypothetical protein
MILVPLADAKLHLHITDPVRDPEVQAKLEQASDAIKKYIDVRFDDSWTETTAPPVVQAATLELLGLLWRDRGDVDDDSDAKTWRHIDILLKQTRDPAMA